MARASDGIGIIHEIFYPNENLGKLKVNTGILDHDGFPFYTDLIEWSAPDLLLRDTLPLAWTVITPIKEGDIPTLIIVAAPDVTLKFVFEAAPEDCSSCHYPPNWNDYSKIVRPFVIRTNSLMTIPQTGDRLDYQSLLSSLYIGRYNEILDSPEHTEINDWITVTRLPTGIAVSHASGHWQVTIEAKDSTGFEPVYTDVAIETYGESYIDETGYFDTYVATHTAVKILRSSNTKVSGFKRSFIMGDPFFRHELTVYDDDGIDPINLPDELFFNQKNNITNSLTLTHSPYGDFVTLIPIVIYLALSFTPVVGEIIDFAELLAIATLQKDLLGNSAGKFEFSLTAASLVSGPFFEGAENAKTIASLAEKFSPGVKVTDSSGHMTDAIKHEIKEQASPVTVAAMKNLSGGEQNTLAQNLVKAVETRSGQKISDNMAEVVTPHVEQILDTAILPSPIIADTMRHVSPGNIESFGDLPTELAGKLQVNVNLALKNGDDLSVGAVSQVETEFWSFYEKAIQEAAVYKVITPLADDLSDPLLKQGYQAYRNKGGRKNVLDWLKRQTNGRYKARLQSLLGKGAVKIINGVLENPKRTRKPVTLDEVKAAAKHYEDNFSTHQLSDTYSNLKTITNGHGHVFEIDHVFEKRFRGYFEDPWSIHDWHSIAVPKNAHVLKLLKQVGWEGFYYNHLTKTRLMKKYIPYGFEGLFTPYEIYLAHYQVLVRELGLPEHVFRKIVHPFMREIYEQNNMVFRAPTLYPRNIPARLTKAKNRTKPPKDWVFYIYEKAL